MQLKGHYPITILGMSTLVVCFKGGLTGCLEYKVLTLIGVKKHQRRNNNVVLGIQGFKSSSIDIHSISKIFLEINSNWKFRWKSIFNDLAIVSWNCEFKHNKLHSCTLFFLRITQEHVIKFEEFEWEFNVWQALNLHFCSPSTQ